MPGATTHPRMQELHWMARGRILTGLLAFTLCAGPIASQAGLPKVPKHEKRHEIDQLEDEWRNAILKSNTSAMDSLLADDYMAITASGMLQTKQQTLDSLRQGRVKFTTLGMGDRKVRFYGATALVTSVADVVGTTPEGQIAGSYRYTRVYVRNAQGAWKIVSFEASRIRDPGERAERK